MHHHPAKIGFDANGHSAWSQDATDFSHGVAAVGKPQERELGENEIKRVVGERQFVCITQDRFEILGWTLRHVLDSLRVNIQRRDLTAAALREFLAGLPPTAAQVEHLLAMREPSQTEHARPCAGQPLVLQG